jgi:hypothetical protein
MIRHEMIELLGWRYQDMTEAQQDTLSRVERIVEIAVLREREACAKVCDELAWDDAGDSADAMRHCAAAIRARGTA